jgi:hypothetical protein
MTARRILARRARPVLACVLAAVCALAACGTTQAAHETLPAVTISAQPQLGISLANTAGTWAAVPMGTSGTNLFWELFLRPAGTTRWQLVTPPGVADNGGLVAAAGPGQSLTVGFRPSQYLTFSPLAATANGGRAWSGLPAVLPGGFAADPDALAAAPGGELIGLAAAGGGTLYSSASAGGSWKQLTTAPALARQRATQECGVDALTAVTLTASGDPLVGASCARPGNTGIYLSSGGSWRAAGPALPTSLSGAAIRVLRLTATPAGTDAILTASARTGRSVVGAWASGASPGGPGQRWTLTEPLEVGASQILSSGPGPGDEIYVLLRTAGGNRLEMCQTPGNVWHCVPAVPAGTTTIVPGPGGQADALAVHGSQLTVWTTTPGNRSWKAGQTIKVNIPYGSSG